MNMLHDHFKIAENAEVSIEMDPREIELSMLDHLRNIGFNRISMGVQDFNKDVQKAVNREQDEAFANALLVRARELGFQSTNLDLIYGLPLQTVESFMFTLQKWLSSTLIVSVCLTMPTCLVVLPVSEN